MAEIGLAVVQTLIAALQYSELKEKCAIWGYKSRLEDLNKTVNTIKRVLMDAESKVLTYEARGYIDELKDALYEADDLFDEFITLLELNHLQNSPTKHSEFFHKVRRFFYSDQNQVSHAYRMFHKVKKIQKKLNAIVDNHQKFSLGVDYEPICMRREETCSYVDVKDIIGRDDDKNTIIDKLLQSKDQHVQILTIVGVGGLGKTALAQLLYNDERLKHEFGDFMFWVCVSDQDKAQFEVKAILCKILELIRIIYDDKQYVAPTTMEEAQKLFREKVREKKFLLVLDDLWNEDREKWVGLETLLKLGQGGSRVLITTRSDLTATSVGSEWTHVLQGLSLDHSWKLFEMTAFNKGINQQSMNHTEMVEIGKKIIEKCNNIPLAIKVVGSLLFGQGISTWRSFEKSGLAKIDNGDNKIMSVLKLSYYNLRSSLKNCFTYCAVFPKDFVINKGLLIHLWMAQGYIEPLNGGQSVEDAAEEHFKILLRRCFFQDVKKDKYDEIESVKIHDLMHDVAQQVGGEEFQVLSSGAKTLRDITRHVSIIDKKCFEISSNWSNLRTLLTSTIAQNYDIETLEDTKIGKWKRLRVLELKHLKYGISLNSIGELQHLRYLNLSCGEFKVLPNSITKLHNLQTLILYMCPNLRRFPHDFSKLVKLSHLNLDRWFELTGMPLGLDKLIGLRVLTDFVVGRKKNITEKQSDDELKALGALTNLTGRLYIGIHGYYKNVQLMKDMDGGYLSKIPGLKEVVIDFRIVPSDVEIETQEAALEKLEPHPNIKILELRHYGGCTIPWWRRANDNSATITQLSNLVSIRITFCENLVSLPSFSKLPFLKLLELRGLKNLEYMETRSSLLSEEATDTTTFFPSLQTLFIEGCPKWKGGWFREVGSGDAHYAHCCDELTSFSFPPCQSLQTLILECCSKLEGLPEWIRCLSSLQSLTIKSCDAMELLPERIQTLTSLQSLRIEWQEWKGLPEISCLTSLQSLIIKNCDAMESLPQGIQTLTSLQTLKINKCRRLRERCREPYGEDWPKIQHIPNKELFIRGF